eukprot:754556-Hanusia_phi.AAC.6
MSRVFPLTPPPASSVKVLLYVSSSSPPVDNLPHPPALPRATAASASSTSASALLWMEDHLGSDSPRIYLQLFGVCQLLCLCRG